MTLLKLLEEGHFYEIQRSPGHRDDLEDQAVSYAGSLRPHYNPNMVLLRTNPLDPGSEIYEFRLEDVLFAEELTSLSKPDGVTVEQTRIWIRRGSPAMCMKPMRVGDSVKEANEENT